MAASNLRCRAKSLRGAGQTSPGNTRTDFVSMDVLPVGKSQPPQNWSLMPCSKSSPCPSCRVRRSPPSFSVACGGPSINTDWRDCGERQLQTDRRGPAARRLSHVHSRRGNRGETLSGLSQGGNDRRGCLLDPVSTHQDRGDLHDRAGGNDLPKGWPACGTRTVDGLSVRRQEHWHRGPERQRRSRRRAGGHRGQSRHAGRTIRRGARSSRATAEDLVGAEQGSL